MTRARRACVAWHIRPSALSALLGCAMVGVLPSVAAAAQNDTDSAGWNADVVIRRETFATPPPEIVDAVLAPRHLNVSLGNLSPDKRWFLDEIGDGPVTMDVFSKPFHGLGGLFIDFAANRTRTLTIRNNAGIRIISATDGTTRTIDVPRGARVSGARWSPDGTRIGYLAHFPDATHIWVADVATGRSRQVTRTPLLATLMTGFQWVGDGSRIGAVLIPDAREPMPVEPASPRGPEVKVAEEAQQNRLRTFRSLLATPHDKALLEWHATGQVALIDVQSRAVTDVGRPAMIRSIDFAPDGRYVRVTRMVKPFSYIVPVQNFGSVEELWDASGDVIVKLDEEPIDLGVHGGDSPRSLAVVGGSTAPTRREIGWRPDGQGLTYLEQAPVSVAATVDSVLALDSVPIPDTAAAQEPDSVGNVAPRGGRRDRVMQWLPPFDSSSLRVVHEQDKRILGHRFSPDMTMLFLAERDGQNTHEFAVYLSERSTKYTLARYRSGDLYASPGALVTSLGSAGGGPVLGGGAGNIGDERRTVQLSSDGQHVFFLGMQHDPSPLEVGPKMFIDRVAIRTGAMERIFESDNDGVFERVTAILDADATRLVISREGPTDVPQNYLRETGQDTQLTNNEDYTPDITRAREESFTVMRPDGFEFRVNVPASGLPPWPATAGDVLVLPARVYGSGIV